jgi:hypothetical protein
MEFHMVELHYYYLEMIILGKDVMLFLLLH